MEMCIKNNLRTIEKKILPGFFADVVNGDKTFEVRKDEDNIQVGDKLLLREWNGSSYTGKVFECEVAYVLRNVDKYGLMNGYCIIGIKGNTNISWEELVEKAKSLGYHYEKEHYVNDVEEVWNEDTGLHFNKTGKMYYWSIDDSHILANNRTCEQMYQIMLALR